MKTSIVVIKVLKKESEILFGFKIIHCIGGRNILI